MRQPPGIGCRARSSTQSGAADMQLQSLKSRDANLAGFGVCLWSGWHGVQSRMGCVHVC